MQRALQITFNAVPRSTWQPIRSAAQELVLPLALLRSVWIASYNKSGCGGTKPPVLTCDSSASSPSALMRTPDGLRADLVRSFRSRVVCVAQKHGRTSFANVD
jgi:hypothetical protein